VWGVVIAAGIVFSVLDVNGDKQITTREAAVGLLVLCSGGLDEKASLIFDMYGCHSEVRPHALASRSFASVWGVCVSQLRQ
jgi:hypothetical protein